MATETVCLVCLLRRALRALSLLRRLMQGNVRLEHLQRLRQLRRIVLSTAFPQTGEANSAHSAGSTEICARPFTRKHSDQPGIKNSRPANG